jgi:UDP-2-acetamido-3-amino-2,3-dideoxy-glucuronate N-acetyltransferase
MHTVVSGARVSISPGARIVRDVTMGDNVVIEEGVTVDEGCVLGHHVVILAGSVLGRRVTVGDNTVIGRHPMRSVRSGLPPVGDCGPCTLADDVQIGCCSVLYAGASIGRQVMIADLVTIREAVTVGEQTIVGRCVAIESCCTIGKRCKLETNAYITAYSELEDDVFVAPMVSTSNDNYMARDKERIKHFKGVTVKRGGRIGANATILPGRTVEEQGVVAAGSVVTHDVPARVIVAGNPARIFRDVPVDQLLENQEKK